MPADDRIGYAVVGLGWISQAAMLPAFANAADSSRLTALVSGDDDKRRRLARRYELPESATFDYDDYDACLDRDDVHAVYIALPNHLHREYAVRAAEKGVHVLCEKPLAPTAGDCRAVIEACAANGVKLMVAYRLHLEPANMRVVQLVQEEGAIGDPRTLNALFTQQVAPGDIRLAPREKGGGPLFDIGIYCLNAARYVFRDEPLRVHATAATRAQPRFEGSHEMVSCILEFPEERHASFTCSFGAAPVSMLRVAGDDGDLGMAANAFNFSGDRELIVRAERERRESFPASDQFGPQLAYFSACIREDRDPEPDGEEGLIDVMITEALHRSVDSGRPVTIDGLARDRRPGPELATRLPPVESPEMIGAGAPAD